MWSRFPASLFRFNHAWWTLVFFFFMLDETEQQYSHTDSKPRNTRLRRIISSTDRQWVSQRDKAISLINRDAPTSSALCHPHTAWQHTDGRHEKLGLKKSRWGGVKESLIHRQKLSTTHLFPAGNKQFILSAHTKHFCFYFLSSLFGQRGDLPADVSPKERKEGRSTQSPSSSPPPPAPSPSSAWQKRWERLDRNYSPCLS